MNELYEEAPNPPAAATGFQNQPTVVIYDSTGNQVNEFHVVQNDKAETYEEGQMKSKFWTHEATLLLIEYYKSYQESMKDPRIKKKDVWNRIANDMGANGYQFHGDMCDKKWRNLKKSYNGVLENNRGPGQSRRLWQYFDVLHDIFSKEMDETSTDAATNPDGASGAGKSKYKSMLSASTEMSLAQKITDGKISTKMLREFFDKQDRSEERRMNQLMEKLQKMHQENLEVMKDRNRLLQRLVDSLSPTI